MKVFTNKKKMRGYREFLYILPFIILVAIFAYYPLYGWEIGRASCRERV